MLPFKLSEADASVAKIERKRDSSPLIRDRLNVLYLLHLGYSRQETAKIVDCHLNSVTNYVKMYNEGGLEAIRRVRYGREQHELREVYDQVDTALESANCSTLKEAGAILASKFGYCRSRESVRRLLHRLGYKRRKTGIFPGKIDDFEAWQAKQEAFIEKLEVLIKQSDDQAIDLVFGDAAHFVYGKFSRFCWSKQPKYRPSGHGRHRINVYGAYDPRSNQVHTMHNQGYINAEFMVEYLHWLRKEPYPNLQRPLHIVLDNARYQHCQFVKQHAEGLNIKLEFLPGYSPNLNLIERLWKYLKEIIGKQFHSDKKAFEQAIVSLLEELANDEHQQNLRSLLNPEFQRFKKSQILGC